MATQQRIYELCDAVMAFGDVLAQIDQCITAEQSACWDAHDGTPDSINKRHVYGVLQHHLQEMARRTMDASNQLATLRKEAWISASERMGTREAYMNNTRPPTQG